MKLSKWFIVSAFLLQSLAAFAESGFETQACKSFRDGLPPAFKQGLLSVPEDPSHPNQKQIRIFYYYKPVAGKKPFLFINGGPAQDSHSSVPNFSLPNSRWNNEEVVFFDQRGTGCSDPYPSLSDPAWFERMKNYGSDGIIADAEKIRSEVFHLATWNIYGHSFGGFTAIKYVIQFPKSLDKVVVYGASVYDDPIQMPVARLRQQNRNAQLLFHEFPKAYENWKTLRAETGPDKCLPFSDLNGCGPAILDAQFFRMFRTYRMGELSEILLHDVLDANGKVAWTPAAIKGLITGQGFSFVTDRKPAICISVMENGMNLFGPRDYRIAADRLRAHGENPDTYPISELRFVELYDDPLFESEVRAKVHVTKPHQHQLIEGLLQNPKLRMFVFSGKYDGSVPAELYGQINELGQNGFQLLTYTNLPFAGHEYQTNPEVEEIVLGH